MKQIIESWDSNFSLVEAKSKRPGVLATWAGEFCFANKPSRNKRVYPTEAWRNALADSGVKRLLENRLMFGTIGHADIDFDTLVREKKVSHVTTLLNFNEKTGVGKGTIDILETPVGNVLHTLLKSGSKICVSSKAIGEYKGEDEEGNQLVDPKKFKVERFDAVVDPGYLQAQPELLEKLEEAYREDDNTEEIIEDIKSNEEFNNTKEEDMSKELAEQLMKEKVSAEKTLADITKSLELSEAKNKNYESLEKENKQLQESVDKLNEEVTTYKEFFKKIGSMEQVKETLLQAKVQLESVKELGSIEEITEQLKVLDDFLELADSPEHVEKALTLTKELRESLGELVSCEKGENPVDKIKVILEKSKKFITKTNDEALESDVTEVSAKFGVKGDKIRNLIKTEGKEDTIIILEDLETSGSKNINNSIESKDDKDKSSSERLLEHYTIK